MNITSWRDRVYTMPVLMHGITPDLTAFFPEFMTMTLSTRSGRWEAVAWPSLAVPTDSRQVTVCEATVLDVREHPEFEPLALVDWRPVDEMRLFELLPDDRCPIPGVVTQTCEVIQSIQSLPLRQLMAALFRRDDVYQRYWTAPASLSHHHAYVGGLAQHSLEVAVATSSVRGVDAWQRDIMLVYALLHDIGKVWAYADGALTHDARRLGHEAIGARELRLPLASLQDIDTRSHEALETLLSGGWKRNHRHPAAALGEIVRAMDRFSAARGVGNASCGINQ